MTRLLRRLGGWCAAHPLRVVAGWLLLAVVVSVAAAVAGGDYSKEHSLPGTEVAAAEDRLQAHFPAAADESADVLLHGPTAARVRAALPVVEAAVARIRHVVQPPQPQVRWSADRRTVLLHVSYDVPRFVLGTGDLRALQRAARAGQGVEGLVAGSLFNDVNTPGSDRGEIVGILVALVVLLLAFGSVIAALMPIATAALAIVTGLAAVRLLANVYGIDGSAPSLATMLGLGVGIDYALFIVTRHREGLKSGLDPREAAATATASAGSSVLWAGVTVVAAICGLAFAGIPLITSLGFSAAIVVLLSVVSALTLLPALLSLTAHRIDRLHVGLPHLRGNREAERWGAWARTIERRPLRYALGCSALLVLLAVPVAGMRLGMPDASSAAPGTDARRVYVLMSHAFGVGSNAPFRIVVALPPGTSPAAVETAYRTALRADPEVTRVAPMTVSPDGTTGVLSAVPRTSPQAAATDDLVSRLREQVLPPVATATHTRTWVTGPVAGRHDVGQRVLDRLPYFVAAVLAVSFLLLMLVFRSLLVPLKAVLLNLLSIAGALGVVVAVFTWGWLRQLVGVTESVPLVDVIPMLMFAIVFGLSMDYEVFLLSRVREEWLLTGDGRGSVVAGLTSTAHVISAAAAIMVAVFAAFTLSHDVVVKMMGLGLAVAVLLDATVIRLILVPATMAMLGDLNWWLPRWLDRLLPHIDIEALVPVTPVELVPGPAGETPPQDTDVPMPRPTP